MTVSAVLVDLPDGPLWFHLSESKEKRIFRRLVGLGWESREIDSTVFLDQKKSKKLKEIAGSERLPIAEISLWKKLFEKLEKESSADKLTLNERKTSKKVVTVPRTRLRSFRFQYRDWNQDFKRSMATFFSKDPTQLSFLWKNAVKALADYKCSDPFASDKRKTLPTPPATIAGINNTLTAQSFFKNGKPECLPPDIKYLDREIAPLTTRNGGLSAIGTCRGGMDLLLARGPIDKRRIGVGEIKVGEDSELFEAFLQAFWYASEVATRHQVKRLSDQYLEDFRGVHNENGFTPIDIFIFSINQNLRNDLTYKATIKVVRKINGSPKDYPGLGKIYLYQNAGNNWQLIEEAK